MAAAFFQTTPITLAVTIHPSNHASIFARAGLPLPTCRPSPNLFNIPCDIFDTVSQQLWLEATDAERLRYADSYDRKFPQLKREVSPHVAMTLSLRSVSLSLATVLGLPYGWQLLVKDQPQDSVVINSRHDEASSSSTGVEGADMTVAHFLRPPATSHHRSTVQLFLLWPDIELIDYPLRGIEGHDGPGPMLLSFVAGMRRQHTPPSPDGSPVPDRSSSSVSSGSDITLPQAPCCITGEESDRDGAHILPVELADWRISWTLRGLCEALVPFRSELPEDLRMAVEAFSPERSAAATGVAVDVGMDMDTDMATTAPLSATEDKDDLATMFQHMVSMRHTLLNRLTLRSDLCLVQQKLQIWLMPNTSQALWVDARKMPTTPVLRAIALPPTQHNADLLLDALSEPARVPALMVHTAQFAYEKFATGTLQNIFKARAFLVCEELQRHRAIGTSTVGHGLSRGSLAHHDAIMRDAGVADESTATVVSDGEDEDKLHGGAAPISDNNGGNDDGTEPGNVLMLSDLFEEQWIMGEAVEVSARSTPPSYEESDARFFVCEAARLSTSYARLAPMSTHARDAGMRGLLEHYGALEHLAVKMREGPGREMDLFARCLEDAEVDYEDLEGACSSASGRWSVDRKRAESLVKKQAADVFFAVWPLMAAGELGDQLR